MVPRKAKRRRRRSRQYWLANQQGAKVAQHRRSTPREEGELTHRKEARRARNPVRVLVCARRKRRRRRTYVRTYGPHSPRAALEEEEEEEGGRRSLMSLLRRPLVIGFSPSARRRPFSKPARSIGAWFAEASATSGGEETPRLGRARSASRPHPRLRPIASGTRRPTGSGVGKERGPLLLLRHPPYSGPSLCATAAKYTAGVYTLPPGTRVFRSLSSALACVAFNGHSNWRTR